MRLIAVIVLAFALGCVVWNIPPLALGCDNMNDGRLHLCLVANGRVLP